MNDANGSTSKNDAARVLVRVRGINKIFDKEQTKLNVLHNVDIDIRAGEIVTIVGPSGAGKSTLLYLIGGLDVPTSGSITFDDKDIARMNAADAARFRNHHLG